MGKHDEPHCQHLQTDNNCANCVLCPPCQSHYGASGHSHFRDSDLRCQLTGCQSSADVVKQLTDVYVRYTVLCVRVVSISATFRATQISGFLKSVPKVVQGKLRNTVVGERNSFINSSLTACSHFPIPKMQVVRKSTHAASHTTHMLTLLTVVSTMLPSLMSRNKSATPWTHSHLARLRLLKRRG